MSHEIFRPAEPTYWTAYTPAGPRSEGVTETNQVTTSGQPEFISDSDPGIFAGLVAQAGLDVLPMPAAGEEVERGRVYDFEGTVYVCVQSHARTTHDPADIPALFTPARYQAEPWVQPTGAQDAYAIGDEVTHDRPADGGNIWLFRSKINANTTEPGRDGTFDRWWEPVEPI